MGSFCCVLALSMKLYNRVCWDVMQQGGASYGLTLGVSWVQLWCVEMDSINYIVMKLVVISCWGVEWDGEPVLSITMLFNIGAKIDQEPVISNYWKYLVGSGTLATCCGWSALCEHYFTCSISWVYCCGVSPGWQAVIIGVCTKKGINLFDSASSHKTVSKINPCMSKYKYYTVKMLIYL